MPNAPNIEGLPVWLQIAITALFGIITLIVGLRGYTGRDKLAATPQSAVDVATLHRLIDSNHALAGELINLERSIGEHMHHMRQNNDLSREICQRLREVRERLDRGAGL
jgi:FKBP-type peptidyl-prolyl cis-trans isomerase 2